MTIQRGFLLVCFAGGILAGSSGAFADDCDLGSAAAIAQAKVPHAITHVMTMEGQSPVTSEMIFLADKAYIQVDGGWRPIPYSPQEQIDRLLAAKARAAQTKRSCQKLTGQSVDGEAATVLTTHSDAGGKPADARMWISERSGLPLKFEMHLSSGAVITDAFRYGDIQAPPGVN